MDLSSKMTLPSNWTTQTEEAVEVEIDEDESEYDVVRSKLDGEARKNLTSVYRIQNPFLYHRYILRKAEYEARGIAITEKSLLHATARSKISSIIENNLDWRLVSRCKFGRGVSFSPSATYANKECSRANGNSRAMIVAKVIVGKATSGNSFMRIPPLAYDTTTGNVRSVYVKYYDDEFYPEYVAYYENTITPTYRRFGYRF